MTAAGLFAPLGFTNEAVLALTGILLALAVAILIRRVSR